MLSDKRMGTDISSIRYSGAINASDKGDFDLAYRYAKEISDPFDRAKALCRIALNSFQMRDLQRANELINEAEKLIAKSGPAPNKLWGLLDIAAAKATIDPASGFEAVNSAIEVLNQFYYTKSQPVGRDFIRDSAIFDENLGALSRTDFQRALRLALSINQSDISTMAQLAVCRGVLERHD